LQHKHPSGRWCSTESTARRDARDLAGLLDALVVVAEAERVHVLRLYVEGALHFGEPLRTINARFNHFGE